MAKEPTDDRESIHGVDPKLARALDAEAGIHGNLKGGEGRGLDYSAELAQRFGGEVAAAMQSPRSDAAHEGKSDPETDVEDRRAVQEADLIAALDAAAGAELATDEVSGVELPVETEVGANAPPRDHSGEAREAPDVWTQNIATRLLDIARQLEGVPGEGRKILESRLQRLQANLEHPGQINRRVFPDLVMNLERAVEDSVPHVEDSVALDREKVRKERKRFQNLLKGKGMEHDRAFHIVGKAFSDASLKTAADLERLVAELEAKYANEAELAAILDPAKRRRHGQRKEVADEGVAGGEAEPSGPAEPGAFSPTRADGETHELSDGWLTNIGERLDAVAADLEQIPESDRQDLEERLTALRSTFADPDRINRSRFPGLLTKLEGDIKNAIRNDEEPAAETSVPLAHEPVAEEDAEIEYKTENFTFPQDPADLDLENFTVGLHSPEARELFKQVINDRSDEIKHLYESTGLLLYELLPMLKDRDLGDLRWSQYEHMRGQLRGYIRSAESSTVELDEEVIKTRHRLWLNFFIHSNEIYERLSDLIREGKLDQSEASQSVPDGDGGNVDSREEATVVSAFGGLVRPPKPPISGAGSGDEAPPSPPSSGEPGEPELIPPVIEEPGKAVVPWTEPSTDVVRFAESTDTGSEEQASYREARREWLEVKEEWRAIKGEYEAEYKAHCEEETKRNAVFRAVRRKLGKTNEHLQKEAAYLEVRKTYMEKLRNVLTLRSESQSEESIANLPAVVGDAPVISEDAEVNEEKKLTAAMGRRFVVQAVMDRVAINREVVAREHPNYESVRKVLEVLSRKKVKWGIRIGLGALVVGGAVAFSPAVGLAATAKVAGSAVASWAPRMMTGVAGGIATGMGWDAAYQRLLTKKREEAYERSIEEATTKLSADTLSGLESTIEDRFKKLERSRKIKRATTVGASILGGGLAGAYIPNVIDGGLDYVHKAELAELDEIQTKVKIDVTPEPEVTNGGPEPVVIHESVVPDAEGIVEPLGAEGHFDASTPYLSDTAEIQKHLWEKVVESSAFREITEAISRGQISAETFATIQERFNFHLDANEAEGGIRRVLGFSDFESDGSETYTVIAHPDDISLKELNIYFESILREQGIPVEKVFEPVVITETDTPPGEDTVIDKSPKDPAGTDAPITEPTTPMSERIPPSLAGGVLGALGNVTNPRDGIETKSESTPPGTPESHYTVKPGDTLWTILTGEVEGREMSEDLSRFSEAGRDNILEALMDRIDDDVELQAAIGVGGKGTNKARKGDTINIEVLERALRETIEREGKTYDGNGRAQGGDGSSASGSSGDSSDVLEGDIENGGSGEGSDPKRREQTVIDLDSGDYAIESASDTDEHIKRAKRVIIDKLEKPNGLSDTKRMNTKGTFRKIQGLRLEEITEIAKKASSDPSAFEKRLKGLGINQVGWDAWTKEINELARRVGAEGSYTLNQYLDKVADEDAIADALRVEPAEHIKRARQAIIDKLEKPEGLILSDPKRMRTKGTFRKIQGLRLKEIDEINERAHNDPESLKPRLKELGINKVGWDAWTKEINELREQVGAEGSYTLNQYLEKVADEDAIASALAA